MSVLNHKIFEGKLPLEDLVKEMDNGMLGVLSLQTRSTKAETIVVRALKLGQDFGPMASAVYIAAHNFQNELDIGFSLRFATESIYDITYKDFWESRFSETDKHTVHCIFGNLAYWISYAGEYPIYEQNELFKRRKNERLDKRFQWHKNNIFDKLETDDKISFCNMLITICLDKADGGATTDYIASVESFMKIFEEYYPICKRNKERIIDEKRTSRQDKVPVS